MDGQTSPTESQCSESEDEQNVKPAKPKKPRKTTHLDPFLPKKINLKRIVINVSDTQYPVVTEVADELQWKVTTKSDSSNWDVYWTDGAIMPDVLFRMNFYQKINHYPGIHVLARKNLLGLNLMAMRQKFHDDYDFFPQTWMLPSQYSEFRHYYENIRKGKVRTYIVKPEADCQGRGIFLTRNIEDVANGNHYVVQRYLTKPFLIDGLKFDMRIYVLLAGTDPLRVYLYHEGLARFATEQYQQPSPDNMDEMCMHLTNYAINKHNPKFVFNTSSKDMGTGHKRSLTSVFKLMKELGYNVNQAKSKIKDLIIKTFISGLPLVKHQYRYCQPEQYSGNMCFHILGFDVMFTNDLRPILLEVNHTPSFTTDTPLDAFIKHNLIKDTLQLLNINPKTKEELYLKTKQYNNLRLLTGKRKILKGLDKDTEIEKAQRERDEYEAKNMGGFEKIHPTDNPDLMEKYAAMLRYSETAYAEENTLRGKMMKEERMKMARPPASTDKQKQEKQEKTAEKLVMNLFVDSKPKEIKQRKPKILINDSKAQSATLALKPRQSEGEAPETVLEVRRPSTGGMSRSQNIVTRSTPIKVDKQLPQRQKIVSKCESMLHQRLASNDCKRRILSIYDSVLPPTSNSVFIVDMTQSVPVAPIVTPEHCNSSQKASPSKATTIRAPSAHTRISSEQSKYSCSPIKAPGNFLVPKLFDLHQQNQLTKQLRMLRISNRCFPLKGRSRAAFLALP